MEVGQENNWNYGKRGDMMELYELGLEKRWDDLVDFKQKGRWLCIYQKDTDGLIDKINRTKCVCTRNDGQKWTVPITMLRAQ